jgi:redox-sensitive bicupin YhaK (pirin superfamily)
VTGVDQRVLLAPDDGSVGPLLRVADDRLGPGSGYGRHEHRAVDVVAVVVSGSLQHRWGDGAQLRAGDVAVLRAGAGLDHDEVAGDDGARVLQCYLRAATTDGPPAHEVHPCPDGWVDLGRPDARLWLAALSEGERAELPEGLQLVVSAADTQVTHGRGGAFTAKQKLTVLVWQLDVARPDWARD